MFEGVHNSYTVALVVVTRPSPPQPASTPANGHSTEWTDGTPSHSSPFVGSPAGPIPGGGFDKATNGPQVAIYPGPASSLSHFRQIIRNAPELVPVSEFVSWSETAAFPQVPNRAAFRVWRKMQQQPHLVPANGGTPPQKLGLPSGPRRPQRHGGQTPVHPRPWHFLPVAELHATADKHRFILDGG